jgi:Zn-dependent protease with chaperone function
MEWKRVAVLIAVAGLSLKARERPAPKATVMVCMDADQHVLMGVRPLASAMFASIGVRIDWRERGLYPAGKCAIQVQLSYRSAGYGKPKALAYAQPYEGTIVIFLDRVQQLNHEGGPSVLAHVLAHEITHVLEGIDRHSETGLMKETWNNQDYAVMRRKPLPFAPEDIRLIYEGLKARRRAGWPQAPKTWLPSKE